MGSRLEAIQKRRESSKKGYDGFWYVQKEAVEKLGIKKWVPEEGTNFIAIIPPKDTTSYWAKELHVHYEVGVNGSAFICPRQRGEKCPICDERDRLKDSGANAEDIAALNWGRTFLYFLVDVKDEKTIDKGIQYAFLAQTIDNEILNLSRNDRTGEDFDISDPKAGCNIIFQRKGSKMTTKYSGFKKEDRKEPLPQEWIDNVPDFDSILEYHDYETISGEFNGLVEEPATTAESTRVAEPASVTPTQNSATQSEPATEQRKPVSGVEALKARLAARRPQ